MATCSFVRRLSGGKTVKVDLEVIDENIKDIVISGDFFLYPEEYIHIIESKLKGKNISEVVRILSEFKGVVEIVGASIEEFAEVVIDAYKACISR